MKRRRIKNTAPKKGCTACRKSQPKAGFFGIIKKGEKNVKKK